MAFVGILRVLIAVARKDLALIRRYPLNLAARIVEPIGWLVPVYFLGRTFARDGQVPGFAAWTGTTDFMAFIVAGWVLSGYVSAVTWGMGFALKNEMDSGVLESNWISPQPPVLLLAGRTIASVLATTVTSLGFGALAVLVFDISLRAQVLPALAIVAPVVIGLYGFGFIVAGAVLRMRDANTLIDTGNFILGILSGRDYPVRVLPRPLLLISLLLPLTYGYDALRAVIVGTRTLLPLPVEIGVMIVFMVVMVVLGTKTFARLERRCRLEGTLSQH
ncbi:MAG TPA: ABC transporter permease [bacterium]|nr:ABC transporter permease [bacterium]